MRSTQSSPGGPPSGLASLLAGLRQAELVVTTSAFVVLAVVIFADVVMRRVTGSGLVWAREIGVLANVVLTIIGIGLASADGTHLRPRLLDHIFPDSWDAALTRVQELLTALAFAALAWIAVSVVLETIELVHDQNRTMRIRQFRHGFINAPPQFSFLQTLGRIDDLNRHLAFYSARILLQLFDGFGSGFLLAANLVEAEIDHDPGHPSGERGIPLKLVEALPRLHPGLLREIESFVLIAHHQHRPGINLVSMTEY